MANILVVKKVYKEQIIIDEGTGDEWICKALNWDSVVVDTQYFVDVKFMFLNFFFFSLILIKKSKLKVAVIHVSYSKLVAFTVLFYVFDFDVAVWISSDLLLEC